MQSRISTPSHYNFAALVPKPFLAQGAAAGHSDPVKVSSTYFISC